MAAFASAFESFILGLVALALVMSAPFLARRSRRLRTKIIDDVPAFLARLKERRLPLLLYLRTFEIDAEKDHWNPNQGQVASSEEFLLGSLRPFGATVAVGRPGETMPPGGAYRLYIADTDWKAVVTRLMEAADAVVFRCGETPGLFWELNQLKEMEILDRTLFLTGCIEESNAVYRWLREVGGLPGTDEEEQVEETLAMMREFAEFSARYTFV
jgi:hypothetical protein